MRSDRSHNADVKWLARIATTPTQRQPSRADVEHAGSASTIWIARHGVSQVRCREGCRLPGTLPRRRLPRH